MRLQITFLVSIIIKQKTKTNARNKNIKNKNTFAFYVFYFFFSTFIDYTYIYTLFYHSENQILKTIHSKPSRSDDSNIICS